MPCGKRICSRFQPLLVSQEFVDRKFLLLGKEVCGLRDLTVDFPFSLTENGSNFGDAFQGLCGCYQKDTRWRMHWSSVGSQVSRTLKWSKSHEMCFRSFPKMGITVYGSWPAINAIALFSNWSRFGTNFQMTQWNCMMLKNWWQHCRQFISL